MYSLISLYIVAESTVSTVGTVMQPALVRVYATTSQEVVLVGIVITSILRINSASFNVLFGIGASHSFTTPQVAQRLEMNAFERSTAIVVGLPNGQYVHCSKAYVGYLICV